MINIKYRYICRVKATDFERLTQAILAWWKPIELKSGEMIDTDNSWKGENKAGLIYLY